MTTVNGDKKKKTELSLSARKGSIVEAFKNPSFQRWLMVILLAIFLTLLLSPNIKLPSIEYDVGDVASNDINLLKISS